MDALCIIYFRFNVMLAVDCENVTQPSGHRGEIGIVLRDLAEWLHDVTNSEREIDSTV